MGFLQSLFGGHKPSSPRDLPVAQLYATPLKSSVRRLLL